MNGCHGPNPEHLKKGAYLLLDPHKGYADCAVIFPEDDSPILLRAALRLSVQGITARLIAVKDFALFERQDENYRRHVLREDVPLLICARENCGWTEKVTGRLIAYGDEAVVANRIKSAILGE